jgi:hypothetical protein
MSQHGSIAVEIPKSKADELPLFDLWQLCNKSWNSWRPETTPPICYSNSQAIPGSTHKF